MGQRAINMAEQSMWCARFFLDGRAGAEHAQIAVELAGVGVDDGAADPLRKLEGERALAAGGRPCDERQRR